MFRFPDRGPVRRVAMPAVVLAAAALHLLLFHLERAPAPRRLWGDEIMYAELAERAARGEPAEVELLWPPLYPRLLAWAARLGPLSSGPPGAAALDVGRARAAVEAAQLALLVSAVLALRALARRVTGSTGVADLAAALALLDPQLASFAHFLWPETLHLALLLGALALLATRSRRRWALITAGLLLGLALLTKSLLQPFLPVLLLPLVAAHGWRRGLGRAALVLAVAAAVIAPTVVANGRCAGTWVVADSARFNLWVGLNDRAPRNFQDEIVGDEFDRWRASAPNFAEREAILARRLDAFVAERGWVRILRDQLGRQYYRLFGAPSFLTDQLPGGAIAALGYGYAAPAAWAARVLRAWSDAHYALLLVAAAFGGVLVLRLRAAPLSGEAERERRSARTWIAVGAAFVAYSLVVLLFLHVKTRYRVPLLPLFDVAAALALARVAHAWRRARAAPVPPAGDTDALPAFTRATLVLGALLCALLVKLAFLPPPPAG
jgi:hypothetical protein